MYVKAYTSCLSDVAHYNHPVGAVLNPYHADPRYTLSLQTV